MKLSVVSLQGEKKEDLTLPKQFSEPVREDIILKSVYAIQQNKRQPYGAKSEAGKRHSADLSKRRRNYRGSYGHGISRVPRKILSRSGRRFNWVAAIMPGVVGGRRAHPPKAVKKWDVKVNKKENRKAIRSALTAVMSKELVTARGHKTPENYPFIIADDFSSLKKTKEVQEVLTKLGFAGEITRCSSKKVRSGKGKNRGRKYKTKKGLLIVTAKPSSLKKAAASIPGVEVSAVQSLNTNLLAPGAKPGRITLFTKGAIDTINKEGQFL